MCTNKGYDPLGILCELHRQEKGFSWELLGKVKDSDLTLYSYYGEECFLPDEVADWAGLPRGHNGNTCSTVARMNDDEKSFRQIALWIKENVSEEDSVNQLVFV